jgi:hypothetical protein
VAGWGTGQGARQGRAGWQAADQQLQGRPSVFTQHITGGWGEREAAGPSLQGGCKQGWLHWTTFHKPLYAIDAFDKGAWVQGCSWGMPGG